MSFDIPAQPLASALQAFAQATGQSVFFDGQLAAGLESTPVHGELATREALQRMLGGTRLAARYADDTTFTLVETDVPQQAAAPASAVPAAEPLSDGNARVVQQALERTLCRWPAVQPGSYRALVQLWVGPSGRVRRTRLLSTTGLAQRDAALESAMNTLVLAPSKDGEGAPDEPLTILLLPRTGHSTDVCAGVAPAAS